MKVSELSGALLDEWVARAEGHTVELRFRAEVNAKIRVICNGTHTRGVPRYSADWAQGGPIMERNLIGFTTGFSEGEWCAAIDLNVHTHFDGGVLDGKHFMTGPTPLIAAMRCFVASKFGEEVADEVLA